MAQGFIDNFWLSLVMQSPLLFVSLVDGIKPLPLVMTLSGTCLLSNASQFQHVGSRKTWNVMGIGIMYHESGMYHVSWIRLSRSCVRLSLHCSCLTAHDTAYIYQGVLDSYRWYWYTLQLPQASDLQLYMKPWWTRVIHLVQPGRSRRTSPG